MVADAGLATDSQTRRQAPNSTRSCACPAVMPYKRLYLNINQSAGIFLSRARQPFGLISLPCGCRPPFVDERLYGLTILETISTFSATVISKPSTFRSLLHHIVMLLSKSNMFLRSDSRYFASRNSLTIFCAFSRISCFGIHAISFRLSLSFFLLVM